MTGRANDEIMAASSVAGAHLAELLALTLIDKGLIDKDDICAELELLAHARQSEADTDAISGKLIELANSIRAGDRRGF